MVVVVVMFVVTIILVDNEESANGGDGGDSGGDGSGDDSMLDPHGGTYVSLYIVFVWWEAGGRDSDISFVHHHY